MYVYDPEHEKYRPWKKRTTWLRVRSYSTTLAGLKAELIARGFVSERRRCSLGVKRAGEWWYESECPQLPNEDYIFVQVVYHRKNRKGRMRGVSGPRPPPDTGPLDDLLDTLTTMTFSIFSHNVPGASDSATGSHMFCKYLDVMFLHNLTPFHTSACLLGAPHSAPPATQNPESVESKKHV